MNARRPFAPVCWGVAILVGVAVGIAAGCGSPTGDSRELRPADERYRALYGEDDAEGRLRFEAKPGWHIVPDATAHLDLQAPDGFSFRAPRQQGPDALEHSEAALEFALHLEAVASRPPGSAPAGEAQARVKFGICRDDATACEIVRRELALPVSGLASAAL